MSWPHTAHPDSSSTSAVMLWQADVITLSVVSEFKGSGGNLLVISQSTIWRGGADESGVIGLMF